MWHCERVMSELNTASLDTKASDAVNKRFRVDWIRVNRFRVVDKQEEGTGNACSLFVDRLSQLTTGAPALNREGNS